jgi:hypothetical protein
MWYTSEHFRQNMLQCVQCTNKIKYQYWNILCVTGICQIFSRMERFKSVIIKKKKELLISDRQRTSVGTSSINWLYNSDQWHLPQTNGLLPIAQTLISWYQTLHFWHFFSRIWRCNSLRSKRRTRHSLLSIWSLVRVVAVGKRRSSFQVSSRFWSQISWTEDFVPIGNIPETEQKKQRRNAKVPQEVAGTATQTNH